MVENVKTIKIDDDNDKPLSREDQKIILEEIKKGFYISPKLLQSYAKAYRHKAPRKFLQILFNLSRHVNGKSITNWTSILNTSITAEKEKVIEENKNWFKRRFSRD